MKRPTIKIGTWVSYPLANRRMIGKVDSISAASGTKLFRVNDRWFEAESLTILPVPLRLVQGDKA